MEISGLSPALARSVKQLFAQVPHLAPLQSVAAKAQQQGSGLSIAKKEGNWEIRFEKESELFRAISLIYENQNAEDGYSYSETPQYTDLGVMVDCSRNAVMNLSAFKKMIHYLALMGYTTVQLYTEDTFAIPEYEYFGYMRGRYTAEELQEMDNYAASFGIELVPCIQTLAHLEHALRWRQFAPMHDCEDILLASAEETYTLIDAMFRTMAENLHSRKINIGMDEAHMLGLGNYLLQHGYQNRFSIMITHLQRVVEIAKKYGYHPMMWSDMFFRLATGGEYYADDAAIPEEVKRQVPEECALVYWDYYSASADTYDAMLKTHLGFGREIIFAGGAWRWHGFTPGNQFSISVSKSAAEGCRRNQIKSVLITTWGDNGAEGAFFALLPTLQFWAESCYASTEESALAKRFASSTGASWQSFLALDTPLFISSNPAPGTIGDGATKYLLYQDVLTGLADYHLQECTGLQAHFTECHTCLTKLAAQNPQWEILFQTQAALCHVLELKADCGLVLTKAYHAGDKETLFRYAKEVLPEISNRLEKFQQVYRRQWYSENKYCGIDVFDLRTGGVKERLRTAAQRLLQYLAGEIPIIEELEDTRLPFHLGHSSIATLSGARWHTIATPSGITGI